MVVVLPNSNKDKYDSIKKFLCVDCPTPSQCVVARTLSRPQALMTVATKIALQMACKMGGELWSVEIPVSPGTFLTFLPLDFFLLMGFMVFLSETLFVMVTSFR